MIYDSVEQKNFIVEAVKKYPCNYESALQLANNFGQSIQDGRVLPVAVQLKALPMPKPVPIAGGPAVPEPQVPANRTQRRAAEAKAKAADKAANKGKANSKDQPQDGPPKDGPEPSKEAAH